MASGLNGRVSPGDGATFTPHVASNGDLSWTNDSGLENPQSVNIKGPKGDRGLTGPTGATGPQGPEGPAGKDGSVSFDDLTPEQKEELVGLRLCRDDDGDICIDYGDEEDE